MTDARTGLRRPATDWEYAVSAADQLMLWHAQVAPYTAQEPLRTRAVVLLAACLSDRATAAHLTGPDIAQVQLSEAATVLERYVLSALQACPAPPSTGDELRNYLLGVFDTDAFETVRHAVRETLTHHMQASGPRARIADRHGDLTDLQRQRQKGTGF
ncbi:hypothetical protein CG740_34935 [Streptomyces sp. CB01201]|uniref:hypothetical protein n=1 Tax=Streptomyces sp. CB01201 TaxID=2020324 RepID=UPI000CC431FA|nr:hypothetical protein [Streptomyces sp. CB01201]PJM98634.1 hypothetical protein CG740_34935 [Streptomyces sp. CB01201]